MWKLLSSPKNENFWSGDTGTAWDKAISKDFLDKLYADQALKEQQRQQQLQEQRKQLQEKTKALLANNLTTMGNNIYNNANANIQKLQSQINSMKR